MVTATGPLPLLKALGAALRFSMIFFET